MTQPRYLVLCAATALLALVASHDMSAAGAPRIVISEIQPSGSSASYGADWFELTNAGTTAIDITGWKIDDSSNAFATAATLNGVTSIAPGQSVIFFESASPATVVSAFTAAWFGASPPANLTFGSYSGAGLGLSGSGDAVNIFDADGQRVAGVAFGAANSLFTFDNTSGLNSATLPLPDVSTLSAAGINGAFLAASGTETGSPGRRLNASPIATVDLSLYVRVGRFDLPEPTRTTPPQNSVLAQEVSAVTYNWDTDTLFVVGDGGTSVVQVTKSGQLIDSMTLAQGSSSQGTEFFDPEGLTYVGNGRFVMVEERDRQAVLFSYVPDTTLVRSATQTVKLGTFAPNIGIEGMTYDPMTNGFIAVKESQPQGIFQTGIDFAAGTATNGSATTENSTNLFDPALLNVLDLADVYALSLLPTLSAGESGHLLVLSHESGRILHVTRAGVTLNALNIQSDPGNPLDVAAQQHEGLTMDFNGNLYVVSENGGGDFDHPQLWVYSPSAVPNQAPAGLALTSQVNSIAENTTTTPRIKVANVVITDDGLGTNVLSVTGVDAGAFEVDASGLYIKAGTVLDFETKNSYSVIVQVDDASVGASPDAFAPFVLTVTDVANEGGSGGGSSLVVSEVAPWSSGNSPVGADWFEVTNKGSIPVDITGWKVDDSSNAFAAAVALAGITSIAPGESVIFIETADLSAAAASFRSTWFGDADAPAAPRIGNYTGGGIGLSTGGDAVNLFDSTGAARAGVTFGPSDDTAPFATFDNGAGLNNAAISQLSVAGVMGAFVALGDPNEIGSPGRIAGGAPAPADRLRITEVAAWSSGNSPVGADWFEVTNTGTSQVNITGWKIDDNSESPAAALLLNGITSIAPGESVIFIETADLATAAALFRTTWFGATAPAGLQIGSYSGAGVGLGTGGDSVNLFNSSAVLRARVIFGASPSGPVFATFDNAAGINGATISQLSAVGVNGGLVAVNDPAEIGSPGRSFTPPSVVITEVTPWSSGNAPYEADWFEVTNTGSTPVDVTGWRMDDSSNAFANAVALRGVTTIPAGKSAVFLESAADGSTDAAIISGFAMAWAGTPTLPVGALVGTYGGAGVGLSTGGDSVVLFDSAGRRLTGVSFGASTTGKTFDNAVGLGSATAPFPMISTLSIAGVNGAFTAVDGIELGSPLTIGGSTDVDGDGIADGVDPAPLNATNEGFSDGTTSGVILARNGKTVTITDSLPDPVVGVRVVVSGGGGGPVLIHLDGKAGVISLPDGVYVLTDPVATSTVAVGTGGPAQITMLLNGLPAVIVVAGGSSVTFTETTSAAGALIGLVLNAVSGTVTLNGTRVTGSLALIGPPQTTDQCMGGGWETFNFPGSFKNQGDCVSYVATEGRNTPAN